MLMVALYTVAEAGEVGALPRSSALAGSAAARWGEVVCEQGCATAAAGSEQGGRSPQGRARSQARPGRAPGRNPT
jgi:hypothetical protein